MKNQGITNMQVGPEATLIPPKSPEFILWGSWLYKASSQQIENRWLIRCGPKHGWNLLTGLDKVILHKGILLVMGRGGGECTPWSRVREQADGHTHSVWSWCWFHSGGGGGGRARKASPHRCSQAAVRGTSTSPLNKDTLSKPENTTIAHLVVFFFFFSKYTVHLKEGHPSAFAGTSSPTRCHWLHWGGGGQSWRKEEAILFFSMDPETADGCTSQVYASTHRLEQLVWLYANVLACGHALSAQQSKRLKTTSDHLCSEEKKYLFNSILHFSMNATRVYCQVMSQTNPSLVSVALSIKTWCVSSLRCKCLWTS